MELEFHRTVSSSKWDNNRAILASGEIEFHLPIEPVSLQASRRKKDVVTSAIHQITGNSEFILTGDIQVDIDWWIHVQDRYEADSSADVDNIIKPILDAMCGPKGILINDCQVQSVCCSWFDHVSDNQKVIIRIKMLDPHAWKLKGSLTFIHMWNGLCYPILLNEFSPESTLSHVESFEKMLLARNKSLQETGDYHHASFSMPIQRIFHISRVQDFPVMQLSEAKTLLQDRINTKK